ncbi:LIM domain and actin-binding protein 1 [Armadillidium vulgare]|nr:LIM domain and actin-binding protein 1 [Armadillidium vulgare]
MTTKLKAKKELQKRRERICSEKQEVEEIFKEAETAKKARNVFKQIDSKVSKEGTTILRSQSFASSGRENRHSMDVSVLMQQHREPVGEVVKADEKQEDFSVDTTDLASRFRFFLNYEKEKEKEMEKNRKVFRITPPREGIDQVEDLKISKANMPKPCMAVNCAACKLRRLMGDDDTELLGRDPNLIKCSDNYQDDIDCRNTRNILQMFKKMEMGEEEEEEDEGPKPLKRFTPPPGEENENDETDEEYSDEEYSDEDEEEDESDHASKVRDELLQMSARKAASLRAKFERWEAEVERKNDINKDKEEVGEECMPSLDTAKNLKAMFEHKAIEVAKPVASKPIKQKVNRFVGGGGEKCVSCGKTVYAMEKFDIHGKILHKQCFKCVKCNTQLRMDSFSFGGGDNMYCITHYKQLFAEKGSYDAFTQEKGKWAKKIESINGDVKSHD